MKMDITTELFNTMHKCGCTSLSRSWTKSITAGSYHINVCMVSTPGTCKHQAPCACPAVFRNVVSNVTQNMSVGTTLKCKENEE